MVTRSCRGYTLIEVMMVVAILGIIGSVGALVTTKTIQSQMMADSLATIQQGAFTSFDVISKMLRQATASSVVIDSYDANQPPWSRVTFSIPNKSQTFTFYQKGQMLYIGNVPSLASLRALTFSYPKTSNPNLIGVSMTFEKSTGSGNSKALQLYIQNVKIQN